jgi:hypothetical protein
MPAYQAFWLSLSRLESRVNFQTIMAFSGA